MDVFFQPNREIVKIIGGPQKKEEGVNYRFIKFLIEDRWIDGRRILFNTLTKVGIVVDEEEYNLITSIGDAVCANYALENYILVPEDFDEASKVIEMREKRIVKDEDFLKKIKGFTILPTTDCNARCYYCFENGHKITVMTMEMANKVADYIIECMKEYPEGTSTELRWFGGEPLYNMKAMDVICSRVKEAGIPFKSHIISNGYLFSEDVIKTAVNDWNLTDAQITLDGSNELYKQIKNYIYNDEDPLETVLKNMEVMVREGFTISVRMNIDVTNADDLKVLLSQLAKRFGVRGKVVPYVHPVFETGLDDETKRTSENRKLVYEKTKEIEEYMINLGYRKVKHGLSPNIREFHCMVDSGESILILPDGKLGLCEHYTDCEYFGQIGDKREDWDWEEVNSLREIDVLDKCKECPFFPECMRLTKCLDERLCDDYVSEWYIRELRRQIMESVAIFYENEKVRLMQDARPRFDLYTDRRDFNNLAKFAVYLEKKLQRINEKLEIDFSDLDEEYSDVLKQAHEEPCNSCQCEKKKEEEKTEESKEEVVEEKKEE